MDSYIVIPNILQSTSMYMSCDYLVMVIIMYYLLKFHVWYSTQTATGRRASFASL